jgi:hypothetical protein
VKSPGLVEALTPFVEALERLDVFYYVSGSVASSSYSVGRSTIDIDIVADLQAHHVDLLVEQLERDYYVDAEMARDAIRRRTSFNIIHIPAMFKIDVFIPKAQPFDQEEARRAVQRVLADDSSSRLFYVSSAEDIVLRKLEWYRLGGEISQRQWLDVLSVLKVQAQKLNTAYLQHWAEQLGLEDLLDRAIKEAES